MSIIHKIVLPPRISGFERDYLRRMNRLGYLFLLAHAPVLLVYAAVQGVSLTQTAVLVGGALAIPTVAFLTFDSPRSISVAFGVTAMLLAGILVHVGQGPMQMEMHFHFFVVIAFLAVFANPTVIVAAAATVAAHHLSVWFFAPRSVFNYDAAWWVVGVHALFVVVESVAACFIARAFFDNVIGLEKIVDTRTVELAHRNVQLRRVLDAVEQGFLEIDMAGQVGVEVSAIVWRWFGDIPTGTRFADLLRRADPRVADSFEVGMAQVRDELLPIDVCIDQLPALLQQGERQLSLAYTPLLGDTCEMSGLLVVMSDVTAQRARERLEAQQTEMARIFQNITRDAHAFLEFWEDAGHLVGSIVADGHDGTVLRRSLHTLKGNAAVFGLRTFSDEVHDIEQRVAEEGQLVAADREVLLAAWSRIRSTLETFLSDRRDDRRIEIEEGELDGALQAILRKDAYVHIARRLQSWRLEPVQRRFTRIAAQIQALGRTLGRGPIEVVTDGADLRFDAARWTTVWSAFIHVVRNAVDHGIETPEERASAGKPATARVELRARRDGDDMVVTLRDDGRGIDWSALARKARAQGLPADSAADLQAALFADGVSTNETATQMSGRGVGLGAVRAAARALGGSVTVLSLEGEGTEVTLRVPLDEAVRASKAA